MLEAFKKEDAYNLIVILLCLYSTVVEIVSFLVRHLFSSELCYISNVHIVREDVVDKSANYHTQQKLGHTCVIQIC
jgi:hypothetical protein